MRFDGKRAVFGRPGDNPRAVAHARALRYTGLRRRLAIPCRADRAFKAGEAAVLEVRVRKVFDEHFGRTRGSLITPAFAVDGGSSRGGLSERDLQYVLQFETSRRPLRWCDGDLAFR